MLMSARPPALHRTAPHRTAPHRNAHTAHVPPLGAVAAPGFGGVVDAGGRHTKIWGEDAAEFRPERFLETNKDGELQFVKPSSFKFTAFQAGKRICMGMNMAYVLLG